MESPADAFVMVDGPSPSEAAHIYNRFFYGLEENTYSDSSIKRISSRRSHSDMQGRLFYDELLHLAMMNKDDENELMSEQGDPASYYPPKAQSTDSIIQLIQLIQASSFDRIKKMALWYYLMLDLDHQAGNKVALAFAKEIGLPRSARYAMTGYWHLDRGDYLIGVSYLIEQPDFVSKIISTISPLPYPSSSRQYTELRAMAFAQFTSQVDVQSLGHELDEAFEEARVVAICWSQGIRAAWVHCQTSVTHEDDSSARRIRLIGRLIEFCFMPNPKPDAVKTLLALPLTEADEEVLCHVLINPPSNIQLTSYAHAVALDVLLVRRINSGQYYDAILLDQRINTTIGLPHLSREGSSDKEREKLRHMRSKREGLIRNAHSVLTSVERQLLNLNIGEGDVSIESEKTGGERGDLEMSWERVGESMRPEQVTPRKSSSTNKPLTPLSASPAIRGEKGDDTASEILLSAIVKASPKRIKIGEMPRSGTASPLSRSILRGSPSVSQGAPLRTSLSGVQQRTPSRSLLASREASAAILSPLSSKRPYHLPQTADSMQVEETRDLTSAKQAEDISGQETEVAGPYARLAEQLQGQLDQNNGDLSLDRILATKSPFRTLQSSLQANKGSRQPSLSLFKPVHRYEATYEIGETSGEKPIQQDLAQNQDEEMQIDDIPKRRGGRPTRKGRGKVAPAKVAESEAEEDDTSVPGSFPGRGISQPPQEERKAQPRIASPPPSVKRRTSRRTTRHTMNANEFQHDEDEVPEMIATPTMKKSRSAAALSRTRSASKLASTPIRRSARLSVEPESTPQAHSPIKEKRSKRGASKGPSLASASEREETENEKEEFTGRSTRSRRASKMPGSF